MKISYQPRPLLDSSMETKNNIEGRETNIKDDTIRRILDKRIWPKNNQFSTRCHHGSAISST